jgi:molybdenum-dependent DNA-binding transcriptional regulator ModE
MKEVIEKLFQQIQQIPLGSTEEIEKVKNELVIAAEGGSNAIGTYFESAGQALVQEAEKLARQLKMKIGVS